MQSPPLPPRHDPAGNIWERFRKSSVFPVASIAILAVIILGIGFGVVGLVSRFTRSSPSAPAKGPENVSYIVAGGAELKLNVLRVTYQDTYNDSKPLREDRKFVVVRFEIHNIGKGASAPFTNADMRLITPDGSIMAPATWSQGFLNTGLGPDQKKEGEVVFDVDERNSKLPLASFAVAFGQNPGSRQTYQLTPL